jgi:hypothetical protein
LRQGWENLTDAYFRGVRMPHRFIIQAKRIARVQEQIFALKQGRLFPRSE